MLDSVSSAFDTSGLKFVRRSEQTVNGKTYICEEYSRPSGTVKYYFDSDSLAMIDCTDNNGDSCTITVTSLSSSADNSAFNIPSGYFDLTPFAGNIDI